MMSLPPRHLLTADLLKTLTLPTTRWTLTLTPLAGAVLTAALTTNPTTSQPWQAVLTAAPYLQAGPILLGATTAGHEYAGTQARTTLLACPNRRYLAAAKLLTALTIVTILTLATFAASAGAAHLTTHTPATSDDTTQARTLAAVAAQFITAGLLAQAVATITRSTTTALAAVLATNLIATPLLAPLCHTFHWLPDDAAHQLAHSAGSNTTLNLATISLWLTATHYAAHTRLTRADA